MRQPYDDEVKVLMPRGTFLVIWQVLTRTMRNPEARTEVAPEKYEISFTVDEPERKALHFLVGAIESAVPEIWTGEMDELVAKEKQRIRSLPK